MSTKLWTGNALAVAQIETYAPGQQLPNTTITATINGKTASYLSPTGSNDDLIKGLIAAINAISQYAPEFTEIQFQALAVVPSVPAPNATQLVMTSKTPGVPWTIAIQLITPPQVSVERITAGKAGVNEVQQFTISPNAENGSTFTLSWGGNTTTAIPTPPSAPTAVANGAGNLGTSAATNYYWVATYETAVGETEPSLATAALSLNAQQATVTIPTGGSTVTARRIYRNIAGGTSAGPFYLVGTVGDNTTTTFADNNSDATIKVNPGPPATNGAAQGAFEALSGVGQGNVKFGGANTAAYAGMSMPTSPIVYTVEFTGTLASAPQSLIGGSVANVTILPPVTIAVSQVGAVPQDEIQQFGWKQVVGSVLPSGTLAVTLPGLGVTTAPFVYNASAATVQAALVAAAGPAYATAFGVSLVQSTNADYIWQVTYQGPLADQAVPLVTVDVSKMVAGSSNGVTDTVTAYQAETQVGTPVGFNAIATFTLDNNPAGGTWGASATLANGNTISGTGLAYNASAATVQAAFPANTVKVSGSAGGPYAIEAVGQAGSQPIAWNATSSLTSPNPPAGSPPSSNTSGWPLYTTDVIGTNNGYLASGTYFYQAAALDSGGATILVSHEISVSPNNANGQGSATIYWNAVPNAATYKLFRGTSSGNETTLIASGITDTVFEDNGQIPTSASPPVTGRSGPTIIGWQTANAGMLATGTYYYKVTYVIDGAETLPSSEIPVAVTGPNAFVSIDIQPGLVTKLYRGTSSGGETTLIGTSTANPDGLVSDNGQSDTTVSAPGPATQLPAPTQTNPSTSSSGGALASNTYYYEVTAYDAAGETTASNEKSIAVTGPSGEVTVNWNAVEGASGYKIYRGTSSGGENVLAGTVTSQSTTSFVDTGLIAAGFTSVEITAGTAGVSEKQAVMIAGATGGTFALAYEGQQSVPLAFNDTSVDVATKITALSTVGAGNLTVSGNAGGPWTVTGAGTLANQPLALIACNGSNLVGSVTSTASPTLAQAATGPNFWDNAQNWSPVGVPANGDSVYFQNSTVDCLYNLSQSGITLANLQIDMSFVNGWIGLPNWNGKYFEYRQQYLQIGVSGQVLVGAGKGSGPTLIKLDTGTNATTLVVQNCGSSTDPTLPAIIWKGNRASGTTTLNVTKGSLGIAVYAGETATVDQINQGYVTNVNSDSNIYVGPGTTIETGWTMTGGQGTLNASCPTLLMEAGSLTMLDALSATVVTTLTVLGGTLVDRTTGTTATLVVGTGATFDRSESALAKTITNCTVNGKGTLLDPNKTLTFTNPLLLANCSLVDVTIDLGTNVHIQRS